MKTRIITAVLALALFLPVLYFSETVIFPIAIAILASVAIWEISNCFGNAKKVFAFFPAYIIAAFLPIAAYYFTGDYFRITTAAFFIYLFYTLAFSVFAGENFKIADAMQIFAYAFYVINGFASMILLRNSGETGQYLLLLVFFGAWFTDTGAYFIGVFFGKHKLIPKVSPKKTVEGAFGGILGCVVGYTVYGLVVKYFFEGSPNFLYLIFGAIIIAVVSQIGDLIASAAKRSRGIKDYGFIFPGHGGVLDRFDSAVAVAPFIYLLTLLSVNFF